MPEKIVTIGVGGAGCAVAARFMHLLATEVGALGAEVESSFFERLTSGVLSPRAVFVDPDPADGKRLRDAVTASTSPMAVHPEFVVSSKESASRLYGRAYTNRIDTRLPSILSQIQKRVDAAGTIDGFLVVHAAGGGSGSGLTARILDQLSVEYRKKQVTCATLLPDYRHAPSPLDVTNAALCLHKVSTRASVCILADNDALAAMPPASTSVADFDDRFARSLTSLALAISEGHLTQTQLLTDLVPTPATRFLMATTSAYATSRTALQHLSELVAGTGAMASYPTATWSQPWVASSLIWRGAIKSKEIHAAANHTLSGRFIPGAGGPKHVIISRAEPGFGTSLHALSGHVGVGTLIDTRVLQPFEALLEHDAFAARCAKDGVDADTLAAARDHLVQVRDAYAALPDAFANPPAPTEEEETP